MTRMIRTTILLVLVRLALISAFALNVQQQRRRQSSSSDVPTVSSMETKPWKFKGHDVFCQVSVPPPSKQQTTKPSSFLRKTTKKPTVLLIHGFGCSTLYWRETVTSLTEAGYEVHALDLFGQGRSAKPGKSDGIEYSIGLWAEQVDAYARENRLATGGRSDNGIVLVGNSQGSLVALAAATGEFDGEDDCNDDGQSESSGPTTKAGGTTSSKCDSGYIRQHISGIGMFNCGIGLNTRNIVKDPKWNAVQRFLLNLTFDALEKTIFGNVSIVKWILDKVVTRDLLRQTLIGLYSCADDPAERIDDDLIDSFYLPAKEPGAAEALCQILTNDAGLSPLEIHAKHQAFLNDIPIHLVWGKKDTVTPLQWQVGQFFSGLASDENNPSVSMNVIDSGHIPFDEVPDVANGYMLDWLNGVIVKEEDKTSEANTSIFGGVFKLPTFN